MIEMLTIKQAADRIREMHPETPISEHSIRIWHREGHLRSVNVGRKILISWASLEAFLEG